MTVSFRSLLLDNPLVVKDANLILRRPRTWVALALSVGGCAAIAALTVEANTNAARLEPAGGALLGVMTAIVLLGASVIVPAFASSTIAGEREQGTLPLLVVTGLSPLRIVIGKIAGVLAVAAPFVGLALATMAFSSMLRGVEALDVVVAMVGVVATTLCAACVGVAVSANTARARVAAPGAVLSGVVPALFCALPTMASVVMAAEGEPEPVLGVAAVIGATMVSAVACYIAWSALAPRRAPRFARITQLYAALTLAVPAAVLVASRGVVDRDVRFGLGAVTGLAVLPALQVFSAAVSRGNHTSTPSAGVTIPLAWVAQSLGLFCLVLAAERDGLFADLGAYTPNREFVFVAVLFGAAGLAAAAPRRLSATAAAVGGGLVVVAALLAAIVAHEFFGIAALNGIHPSYADTGLGGVLWLAVGVVALAASHRARSA